MSKVKIVEVTGKLVELLMDLEPEDRHRSVQAAFTLLGETPFTTLKENSGKEKELIAPSEKFSSRIKIWMKQNEISTDQLNQIFHLNGEQIEIIGTIPGQTKNDQTLNAYILQGLASFVLTSDPKFEDASARALCEMRGCYNSRHHSEALAAKGNRLAGSKQQGWTLTDPGLLFAATLVKQIAPPIE